MWEWSHREDTQSRLIIAVHAVSCFTSNGRAGSAGYSNSASAGLSAMPGNRHQLAPTLRPFLDGIVSLFFF
jgi:hypothetical protein